MTVRAIDAFLGHYKDNKNQKMEISELGVTVYWTLLTTAMRDKLIGAGGDDVDVVAKLACDANGEKLFDIEDKQKLRDGADADIISRVARRMLKVNTPAQAEKN